MVELAEFGSSTSFSLVDGRLCQLLVTKFILSAGFVFSFRGTKAFGFRGHLAVQAAPEPCASRNTFKLIMVVERWRSRAAHQNRIKNPETGKYFELKDFYVGKTALVTNLGMLLLGNSSHEAWVVFNEGSA